MVIYDFRVSIIHNERMCGYVLRSWPGIERLEAAVRRIFNPGRGEIVRTLFLGQGGTWPPFTLIGTKGNNSSIEKGSPRAGDRRLLHQKNTLRTSSAVGLYESGVPSSI